jgi:hypothetical protein
MSEVSRRKAILTLAAGTAGATAVIGATPSARASTPHTPGSPPSHIIDEAREAALTVGRAVEDRTGARNDEAQVLSCRSWDGHVYLYINDRLRGFVPVNAQAFAIAVSCRASGRPVAARHWGHDPRWGGGVGRFEGALLSLDLADLPTDATQA